MQGITVMLKQKIEEETTAQLRAWSEAQVNVSPTPKL